MLLLGQLGQRSIVFVGLMGAGKTAIGRKVARRSDWRSPTATTRSRPCRGMTIPELFERYGETEFRALEQRVILRLLERRPPGGVDRRRRVHECADPRGDRRARRVGVAEGRPGHADGAGSKKQNRPLLKRADPRGVMLRLMRSATGLRRPPTSPCRRGTERKEVIAERGDRGAAAFAFRRRGAGEAMDERRTCTPSRSAWARAATRS